MSVIIYTDNLVYINLVYDPIMYNIVTSNVNVIVYVCPFISRRVFPRSRLSTVFRG